MAMTMTSSQPGIVRMLAVVAVLLACAGGAGRALAEWQPTKPVQFIVMAGQGGGADKATRAIVEMITKQHLAAVPFEVVNMPGHSGGDALGEMIKRSGDNHLLLFTLNSFYTTPLEQPALKADIAKFGPVARMGEDVFLLWVNARQSDIRNIEDFAAAAKAKGKGWVMVGTGRGSEDQMLTDFLNATYGLEMTYVAKGGGGEVARELVEQRADSTVNNPSEQSDFYPKGLTKPIVAFTPARLKAYVAVPTLRETGMDFTYFMQRSVVGPPGMSTEALAWYQALFKALFESPAWQAYRQKNSLSGAFLSGPALMDYWLAEREKHSRWKMAIDLMGGK